MNEKNITQNGCLIIFNVSSLKVGPTVYKEALENFTLK